MDQCELASLVAQMVKNLPQCRRPGFDHWVGKIPWRRVWPPTPVFLPGKYHGQRSLAGYSPWGRKELDMTERITPALVNTCISLEWNLKAWSHLLEWRPPHFVHPKKIT